MHKDSNKSKMDQRCLKVTDSRVEDSENGSLFCLLLPFYGCGLFSFICWYLSASRSNLEQNSSFCDSINCYSDSYSLFASFYIIVCQKQVRTRSSFLFTVSIFSYRLFYFFSCALAFLSMFSSMVLTLSFISKILKPRSLLSIQLRAQPSCLYAFLSCLDQSCAWFFPIVANMLYCVFCFQSLYFGSLTFTCLAVFDGLYWRILIVVSALSEPQSLRNSSVG